MGMKNRLVVDYTERAGKRDGCNKHARDSKRDNDTAPHQIRLGNGITIDTEYFLGHICV